MAAQKRLKGSTEMTHRQPRKDSKPGRKRLKGSTKMTHRQPRKDSKPGKKTLRLVAMADQKRIKKQAR